MVAASSHNHQEIVLAMRLGIDGFSAKLRPELTNP
jgi:hypothetical protein